MDPMTNKCCLYALGIIKQWDASEINVFHIITTSNWFDSSLTNLNEHVAS